MTQFEEFEKDAEAAADAPLNETKLGAVAAIANRQLAEEDEVAALESRLKEAKARLFKTTTTDLPQALLSLGLRSVTLDNGCVVKVNDFYEANIPAPGTIAKAKGSAKGELAKRAQACYAWLREHEYGDLIKRQVAVEFGRGEDGTAEKVAEFLRSKGLPVVDVSTVHPSTLKSFVKERIESGEPFPVELFNVTVGSVSKIERP